MGSAEVFALGPWGSHSELHGDQLWLREKGRQALQDPLFQWPGIQRQGPVCAHSHHSPCHLLFTAKERCGSRSWDGRETCKQSEVASP